MAQKININDLMQQYGDLLGEDTDEIQGHEVELDPEMKALQKQLDAQKKVMDNMIQKQQGKQAFKSNDDDLDNYLKEYENPQQIKQPIYQEEVIQKPKPVVQQTVDFAQIESELVNVDKMQSLILLQHEIEWLKKAIAQVKKNKELVAAYEGSINVLQLEFDKLCKSIKSQSLTEQKYFLNAKATFQAQEQLFMTQTNKLIKQRIVERLQKLNTEIKQTPFKTILRMFKLGEDEGLKLLMAEFEDKPYQARIKELLTRHKQYLNLAKYYSAHMKQEKDGQICEIIEKLERSKGFQEKFKSGQDVSVSKLVCGELPEISEEYFLGMNDITFKSELQLIVGKVQQALKDEEIFLKIAPSMKPQLQKINNKMVQVNPVESSKLQIATYQQLLEYLSKLPKWTPLPILKITQEQRSNLLDNREVPANVIRIIFKRINKSGKHYLTYSIDLASQVIQQQTHIFDKEIINYQFDLALDKNNFKDLEKKRLQIQIKEKGFFSDDVKGQGIITFTEFADEATLQGQVKLSDKIELDYQVLIREPINKKKANFVVSIERQYPPFDKNFELEQYLETKIKEFPQKVQKIQIEEEEPEIIVLESPKEQKQQPKQQPAQEAQPFEEESPDFQVKWADLVTLIHQPGNLEYDTVFKFAQGHQLKEDLLNPEDPYKGAVYFFIESYEGYIKNKTVEYRQDLSLRKAQRYMQELWENMLKQKKKIMQSFEYEGGMEAYALNLQKSIERDKQLLQIYQQLKVANWAKFVEVRLTQALKEEKELSEQ